MGGSPEPARRRSRGPKITTARSRGAGQSRCEGASSSRSRRATQTTHLSASVAKGPSKRMTRPFLLDRGSLTGRYEAHRSSQDAASCLRTEPHIRMSQYDRVRRTSTRHPRLRRHRRAILAHAYARPRPKDPAGHGPTKTRPRRALAAKAPEPISSSQAFSWLPRRLALSRSWMCPLPFSERLPSWLRPWLISNVVTRANKSCLFPPYNIVHRGKGALSTIFIPMRAASRGPSAPSGVDPGRFAPIFEWW